MGEAVEGGCTNLSSLRREARRSTSVDTLSTDSWPMTIVGGKVWRRIGAKPIKPNERYVIDLNCPLILLIQLKLTISCQ